MQVPEQVVSVKSVEETPILMPDVNILTDVSKVYSFVTLEPKSTLFFSAVTFSDESLILMPLLNKCENLGLGFVGTKFSMLLVDVPKSDVFSAIAGLVKESLILNSVENNFGILGTECAGVTVAKHGVSVSGPHCTSVLRWRTPLEVLGSLISRIRKLEISYATKYCSHIRR